MNNQSEVQAATRRRALCIGVTAFDSPTIDCEEPDLPLYQDLPYAIEYTQGLCAALRECGYEVENVLDPAKLHAESLGRRVEQHLIGDGVALVHVLSHGRHTKRGGVYVVGSDAQIAPATRVEAWCTAVAD